MNENYGVCESSMGHGEVGVLLSGTDALTAFRVAVVVFYMKLDFANLANVILF